MKLRLPNNLRKLALVSGLLTTTTPAFAVNWDKENWGEDVVAKAPSEVKELGLTKEDGYSYIHDSPDSLKQLYVTLADDKYSTTDENGKHIIAFTLNKTDLDEDGAGAMYHVSTHIGYQPDLGCVELIEGAYKADVWLNITGGEYAEITGGLRLGNKSYVHNPDALRGKKITFKGDTHILVGKDATITRRNNDDAITSFTGGLVGGHQGSVSEHTVFEGSTYLTVNSSEVDYIIGGSLVMSTYQEDPDTTSKKNRIEELWCDTFHGNTHVYINNVQPSATGTKYDRKGEYYTASGKYKREWSSLADMYYLGGWRWPLCNFVIGGNRVAGSGYTKFIGSSTIVINLKDREGSFEKFEKNVYGGDFATIINSYVHSLHDGDTYVTITNADKVIFTESIVGGSAGNAGIGSIELRGSTHLTIDSGIYQQLIVGGNYTGEYVHGDWGSAGRVRLTGSSNVNIQGGTYEGYAYEIIDADDDADEGKTLGAVSVIGGNGIIGNIEQDTINIIQGGSNTEISGGTFKGHIVGSTALLGETEAASGIAVHIKGSTKLSMSGGEMVEKASRVVGGMMMQTTQAFLFVKPDSSFPWTDWKNTFARDWQRCYFDYVYIDSDYESTTLSMDNLELWRYGDMKADPGVSVGDVEVEVSGKATVYDVVGGSWVASPEVPGDAVAQGEVKVTLGSGATVKGNVYAAGIQAGETPIVTKSTEVNIEKDVVFTATPDAPAVVSGGYLCADAQETEQNADAWKSWRDAEHSSTVTGKRTLAFTSEGETYSSKDLEGVYFTNFDEVKVAAKDVKIGALLYTDPRKGQEAVTISGDGTLSIVPTEVTIKGFKKQEDGVKATTQTLPNLPHVNLEGATLRLLATETKNAKVERVSVSNGGTLYVNAAPDVGNSTLHVTDGIHIGSDSTLLLRTNLTTEMAEAAHAAIVQKSTDAKSAADKASVTFADGNFDLRIRDVDDELAEQEQLHIVLIDKVSGTYSITSKTLQRIEREFADSFNFDKSAINSAEWDEENLWIGVDENGAMVINATALTDDDDNGGTGDDSGTGGTGDGDGGTGDGDGGTGDGDGDGGGSGDGSGDGGGGSSGGGTGGTGGGSGDGGGSGSGNDSGSGSGSGDQGGSGSGNQGGSGSGNGSGNGNGGSSKPTDTHYHRRNSSSSNGFAGGALLDDYYSHGSGSNGGNGSAGGSGVGGNGSAGGNGAGNGGMAVNDREKLLDRLIDLNADNKRTDSDHLQAAVAGVSLSALGTAAADDVDRQLRLMRNRSLRRLSDAAAPTKSANLWLNAESDYRQMKNWSTNPGYSVNAWGGTVGGAYTFHKGNAEAGLAVTAMYGDLTSKGPDSLRGDMDTQYLSAFLNVAKGRWTHSFIATVGLVDVDATRSVNIGGDYGSYTTNFTTEGHALGLMYEVSRSFNLNRAATATLQPVLNIAWRHVELDGFTEHGTDAALRAGDQKVDTVIVGAGARLQAIVDTDAAGRDISVELRALAKGYFGDLSSNAQVGFADMKANATIHSRKSGAVGGELGVTLTVPLSAGSSYTHALFMDANMELRDAYRNENATIGYKLSF